ncbi:hypothetical protein Hanom_Chr09g00834411 [Helianthus anomalus]
MEVGIFYFVSRTTLWRASLWITFKMHSCGDNVTKIEVKPACSWRAKSDDDEKV